MYKMKDDLIFNIKFIKVIEKHSVLYDQTMFNYSNRMVQEETWNEIAKELNETARACKDKWRHIRSAFSRYLRQKCHMSTKKRYYLAEYLNFLLPFTKTKPIKNLNQNESDTKTDSDFNGTDEDSNGAISELSNNERGIKIEETTLHDVTEIEKNYESENDMCQNTNGNFVHNESSIIPSKRKMEFLENSSCISKRTKYVENEDPEMQFLKSLLPDIYRMNPLQKHQFKFKTIQIIGDILYNQK